MYSTGSVYEHVLLFGTLPCGHCLSTPEKQRMDLIIITYREYKLIFLLTYHHLVQYHQRENNLMTFILSAVYSTGWVAMGFSKDGMMTGSSAMVGWFTRKGHARIKQYYLQGTRPSQVIEDAGELPLTKVPPAVVLHGPMIYLAFQAKFEKPLTYQPIILAFATRYPNHYRLSSHDDKTTILFDFSAGLCNLHLGFL